MQFRLFLAFTLFCASALAAPPDDEMPLPAPSSVAQKLYASAKSDILQLRVLLKNGLTQSSVGSGFMIGTSNLVVTNYHVVSQIALEPETYSGEYVDTNNRRGPVELLAVDVLHDLAVVRINRTGNGFFNVPDALPELRQGQYLYSLGNPLDLGFAISEGTYNGVVSRSFYDQLMFTGAINAGMSGGPNITTNGHLAGVNVSKRLDGELVSFLVPVRHVRDLLKRVAAQQEVPKDFKAMVAQQLLQHQATMVERLTATPLTFKMLPPYRVPVWESDQMRCWGQSGDKENKPYTSEQVNCSMESALFVSGQMETGHIAINHRFFKSRELGAWRFATLAGKRFGNQFLGSSKDKRYTASSCHEEFVNNGKLTMRVVLCARAYRKFPDLYDFALLTASTDDGKMSLQSRIDADGLSYENGLRIARLFLNSTSREEQQ